MIPRDKILHFIVGAVIAAIVSRMTMNVADGFFVAAAAEVGKIVLYDFPRTPKLDFREKGFDLLAQILGASSGCLFMYLLTA